MMENKIIRTDLALEAFSGKTRPKECEGVRRVCRKEAGVEVQEVEITSESAARLLGKQKGRYLTLSVGRLWEDTTESVREKTCLFARELKRFLPGDGCVLLVGLGNRHITADAIGPMSMEHVLVTRHLQSRRPDLFSSLSLSCTAAITPGVLGETGIESADVIRSVVERLSPSAVVCVDALASRSLSRLATTVQLCDAGIAPGSGVGNRRDAIDEKTLGVPVLAIGVPTVVDAWTLAWDVLSACSEEGEFDSVRERLRGEGLDFFVAPKETDQILKEVSALIGHGINLALHPSLSYEEMLSLL